LAQDNEEKLQNLFDREAIRDVYARYGRGIDRADAALIASSYHPDAVEDHHGETFTGATVGAALAGHALRGMERTSTHFTNISIALDGDEAGAEAYYIGLHVLKGGEKRLMTSGRTFDRFERRDGEWRFSHRVIAPEMVKIMPLDEISAGGVVGERGANDPSYAVLGQPRAAD
jgi:ketosteroid isomerase-like protein